jgi:hypothetical protein
MNWVSELTRQHDVAEACSRWMMQKGFETPQAAWAATEHAGWMLDWLAQMYKMQPPRAFLVEMFKEFPHPNCPPGDNFSNMLLRQGYGNLLDLGLVADSISDEERNKAHHRLILVRDQAYDDYYKSRQYWRSVQYRQFDGNADSEAEAMAVWGERRAYAYSHIMDAFVQVFAPDYDARRAFGALMAAHYALYISISLDLTYSIADQVRIEVARVLRAYIPTLPVEEPVTAHKESKAS